MTLSSRDTRSSSLRWAWRSAVAALLLPACFGGSDAAACGQVEDLLDPRGAVHVIDIDSFTYRDNPPTSGPHWGGDRPDTGVYAEPLHFAFQVLALEYGGVVVQYSDRVGESDVLRLEALADRSAHVIVTPSPGPIDGDMDVAFTAWGFRQRCTGVSGEVIASAEEFVDRHAGEIPAH